MVNTRKRTQIQKLVIPKGLLGPNDIAVVEIPRRYRRLPVIVAKPHIIGPRAEDRAEDYFIDGPKDDQSYRRTSTQVPTRSINSSAPVSGSSTQSTTATPTFQSRSTSQSPQVITFQDTSTTPQQNAAVAKTTLSQKASTTASTPSTEYYIIPCATPTSPCRIPLTPKISSSTFSPMLSSTMTKPAKSTKIPTTRYTCDAALSSCLKSTSSHSQYSNYDLAKEEILEKDSVRKSLEEFQEARRKFLNSANALAGKMRACYNKHEEDDSSSSDDN